MKHIRSSFVKLAHLILWNIVTIQKIHTAHPPLHLLKNIFQVDKRNKCYLRYFTVKTFYIYSNLLCLCVTYSLMFFKSWICKFGQSFFFFFGIAVLLSWYGWISNISNLFFYSHLRTCLLILAHKILILLPFAFPTGTLESIS